MPNSAADINKKTRVTRRLPPRPGEQPLPPLRPASALRASLAEGYGRRDVQADLMAGIVVGLVALPLSMALAIASGVPPQHGLYTAIVAGGLVALLGGSRVQVSGPTAAFVVMLAPISAKFGLGGLLLATLLAGIIQMLMGWLRLGQLIQFIPHPVTSGFTAGIAVVIATIQVKDFLGLSFPGTPETWFERVTLIAEHLSSVHWPEVALGLATLAVLILWPRVTRKVPAPLVALGVAAAAAFAAKQVWPALQIATINSRFNGIPQLPPLPCLPWNFPGPDGQPMVISLELLRDLALPALAIAMLGAIESLLSAVVADGMTGQTHDPDAELLAQGTGNIVAPFFGGFAATGAIARTATNVRSGGRSPLAAVFHALFVLAAVLAVAPLLGYLPMAALAALLLLVAWNMSEVKHFVHVVRVAPQSDVLVLLTCFTLTVVFDMVVAVTAGIVLAALLFMRRMAEVTGARLVEEHHRLDAPLPPGVVLYEIAGPLFFGAAQKAMSALGTVGNGHKVVLLDLRGVPAMDATGLVNLESTLARLQGAGIYVILAGVQPQPGSVLEKAGWQDEDGKLAIRHGFDEALVLARQHVEKK
ncbi:MAG: C4-dicarboxylic acid transporter DauA [Planctomycetes bacterium]|nr:C4-dicarboxylic acid transporter DauA [Planctomycetota bacterium]